MRRKNNITSQYIDTRILQLKEDHDKAKDPHDQKWYNRLIQELEWARQAVSGKFENPKLIKNSSATSTISISVMPLSLMTLVKSIGLLFGFSSKTRS